jgi:hypothetical protein
LTPSICKHGELSEGVTTAPSTGTAFNTDDKIRHSKQPLSHFLDSSLIPINLDSSYLLLGSPSIGNIYLEAMSRSPERRSDGPGPVRHSAETLGINRPTPMPELMKIINRGMDKEKSFAYWMNRATKWREELVKAVESGNKEWIFVCAARTAAIIFEKTLKHPNVNKELTSTQIRILQNVSLMLP